MNEWELLFFLNLAIRELSSMLIRVSVLFEALANSQEWTLDPSHLLALLSASFAAWIRNQLR